MKAINKVEEIAKLPNERRLWWFRKLYNLPPTDPRFLDVTEEQIQLEWEHYILDNPDLKPTESYYDASFEEEWEELAPEVD